MVSGANRDSPLPSHWLLESSYSSPPPSRAAPYGRCAHLPREGYHPSNLTQATFWESYRGSLNSWKVTTVEAQ